MKHKVEVMGTEARLVECTSGPCTLADLSGDHVMAVTTNIAFQTSLQSGFTLAANINPGCFKPVSPGSVLGAFSHTGE